MKNLSYTILANFFVLFLQQTATAESIFGRWKTIDDETGAAKSIVEIYQKEGKPRGKIIELINPSQPNPVCRNCEGDRKNKPIIGMEILWDLKKDKRNENTWKKGRIFSPTKGKDYRAKVELDKEGKTLHVRGCWGPFCRKQVWHRVSDKKTAVN